MRPWLVEIAIAAAERAWEANMNPTSRTVGAILAGIVAISLVFVDLAHPGLRRNAAASLDWLVDQVAACELTKS